MTSEKEKFATKMSQCRVFLMTGSYPEGLNNSEKRMLRSLRERFMVDESGKLLTIKGRREVVIDQKDKEEKIKQVHEGKVVHRGRDNTIQRISAKFYWKAIGHDVIEFIRKCNKCQKNRIQLQPRIPSTKAKKRPLDQAEKPTTGALHSIPVSDVWERVGIDIVGPLPKTDNGNEYLVTLCDLFSRWPEAAALPDKSADSVAKFLMEVMMRMGFVRVITNEDEEFVKLLNAKLSEKCNRELSIVEQCHFQANRLVKRFSNTLQACLTKVVDEDLKNWDDHVDKILFAYRTSVHATTKLSPFLVMFGREAMLPLDMEYFSSRPTAPPSEPESYENFVKRKKEERKHRNEQLKKNMAKAQNQRQKSKEKHSE